MIDIIISKINQIEKIIGEIKKTVESTVSDAVTDNIDIETLRESMAEKSRAGYTDQVRELLAKFGATKLSDIDPADYAALLAAADNIGRKEEN